MKTFFKKIGKALFGNKNRKIITVCVISGVLTISIIAATVALCLPLINKELGGSLLPSVGGNGGFVSSTDKNENSSNTSGSGNSNSSNSNSNNSNSNSNGSFAGELLNPGSWEKVAKATMPNIISGDSMTQRKMEELFRPHTDWRIYEIRTTETTVKPTNGGTAYYVSNRGKVNNDGKSPETPLKNVSQIGNLPLKAGDVVYFERGSVFRGNFTILVEGVTYSAYGEGKKPEFYGSPQNYTGVDAWEETDVPNVYVCADRFFSDIGTIVFDDEKCAIKVLLAYRDSGDTYNYSDKSSFTDYRDLKKNLQFYHDYSNTGKLYLRCDAGNPGEIFDSIELNVKGHGFSVRADNVTIDNLCVKYVGSHGISSGARVGLTVQNCEFGWIGGAVQMVNNGIPTRFGNGVEIWGSAKDFTVKNCYFYQNYDAGATFQYKSSEKDRPQVIMSNIDFSDNVMEYCNYSIEYFLTSTDNSYIENFTISNNLMWYAGEGFCSQRPDKTGNTHIKSWLHQNRLKGYFNIKNNLFALAQRYLSETYDITGIGANYDSNIYIQRVTKYLGQNASTREPIRFGDDVAEIIKQEFRDNNAKVIHIVSD